MPASETRASTVLARKIGYCLLPLALGLSAALSLLLLVGGPVRLAKAAPAASTYPGCGLTIQQCLDNAGVGETIVISPGTYITSLTLSQAVNLTGVNSATTILQALSGQRVLTVTGVDIDSSIVISGLTFTGGSAGGGSCPAACGGAIAILNQAEPRLQNLIVISNTAGRAGGGVYVDGTLGLKASRFENNHCTPYPCDGGALNVTGALTITDSQFMSNTAATSGGAVFVSGAGTSGPVKITRAFFQGNQSAQDGGALLVDDQASTSMVLASTQFIGNSTGGDGGAANVSGSLPDFTVYVQNDLFQNNAGTAGFSHGGGLAIGGAAAFITTTQFVSNTATGPGGGLFSVSGTTFITTTDFLSNTASGLGGGLYAGNFLQINSGRFENNQCVLTTCKGGALAGLYLTVNNVQILSNTAQSGGGGIYALWQGTLTGGDLQGNTCIAAACHGGALLSDHGSSLVNVNIFSNMAQSHGGGIYATGGLTVTGGRLQENSCQEVGCLGGGVYADNSLELTNTQILSNSSTGSGGGAYSAGALTVHTGLFADNQCQSNGCTGGGLRAAGTLTLNGTTFLNNHSRSNGGGAYAAGAASVQSVLFQDNQCGQAGCSGGGLYAKNELGLYKTRFLNNAAQANGGGLAQVGGNGQVINTLFARNSTLDGNGEALYLASPLTVTVLHNTIASPTLGSGAAIAIVNGTVRITDTIITSYTTGISRTAGSVFQDYNLFFTVPVSLTAGVSGGAHNLTGDPLFVNTASDNYHLSSGSPALDVGANAGVATDIDGDPRPRGAGFDIGYDEARSPSALGDSFSTAPNTPLVVPAPGMLANDSTLNAGPLTAISVSVPATGTLVLAPSGAFTYTPPLNFTGPVTFTYRADDGQFQSAPATVTITVNAFKLYLPLVRR